MQNSEKMSNCVIFLACALVFTAFVYQLQLQKKKKRQKESLEI